MIKRSLLKELVSWKRKENRKPIVLRGARQVGKTTLIKIFAENFEQFIYLNLELFEDRKIFDMQVPFDDLVASIFLAKNKSLKKETLLFIDEIQNSSQAVSLLRFFYEKYPELYVIAAGSLMEMLVDHHISFPVGRVEYYLLYPFSFVEFLSALEENNALDILSTVDIPEYAHDSLLRLYNKYVLVGGMPEAVSIYSKNRDITETNKIYENLIVSYKDDVEKYSKSQPQTHVIRHIIDNAFREAGCRIKFEGFGNGPYRSREIGEGMRILEKAMIIHLVYPTTGYSLPITEDGKKSPRLHVFDTGLVNFASGIQSEILISTDLSALYKGRILEHITGQEILASSYSPLRKLQFWVKEKKQSNAEIDYIIPYEDKIIPIEVKSGTTGRLRSLHQFMAHVHHPYAIRLYGGKRTIEQVTSIEGKKYYLLNLPYYMAGQIEKCIEWFIHQV